jgi:hypothetical protein
MGQQGLLLLGETLVFIFAFREASRSEYILGSLVEANLSELLQSESSEKEVCRSYLGRLSLWWLGRENGVLEKYYSSCFIVYSIFFDFPVLL